MTQSQDISHLLRVVGEDRVRYQETAPQSGQGRWLLLNQVRGVPLADSSAMAPPPPRVETVAPGQREPAVQRADIAVSPEPACSSVTPGLYPSRPALAPQEQNEPALRGSLPTLEGERPHPPEPLPNFKLFEAEVPASASLASGPSEGHGEPLSSLLKRISRCR